MIGFDPAAFARDWVAAWNRSDAEWVLAHFAEDAVFVSPLAARITGAAEISGKAALRDYWQKALRARAAPLRFELVEGIESAVGGSCLIVYIATEPDGSRQRKAELFQLRPNGLIGRGEAFAGATLPPRG